MTLKKHLSIVGREKSIFLDDLHNFNQELNKIVAGSKFLVLGGAGTIGQAVTKEIFQRNPVKLHVVDISENNLVELVRDIRSAYGYILGDFQTFALDIGSVEYDAFLDLDGVYDYVLNLSALKHVRSESDPFTLMRMISVNILNTKKTIHQSLDKDVKKYFCVSTDKAANPINFMGASKKIMEILLIRQNLHMPISTARFANVAFSDGSLLHGFTQRINKIQPIVAPNDVKRYFITAQEAGELCLMSCIFGKNREIYFPKLNHDMNLQSFSDIAIKFLQDLNYEPVICESEDEARHLIKSLPQQGRWPCLFSKSDTTGEKEIEEFFTVDEKIDLNSYLNIGVIENNSTKGNEKVDNFISKINDLKSLKKWNKHDLLILFKELLQDFNHSELNKYLDQKM